MTSKELKKLVKIAQKHLLIPETRGDLEERYIDSEDFHDCSVWCLKAALIEAYELGKKEAQK